MHYRESKVVPKIWLINILLELINQEDVGKCISPHTMDLEPQLIFRSFFLSDNPLTPHQKNPAKSQIIAF